MSIERELIQDLKVALLLRSANIGLLNAEQDMIDRANRYLAKNLLGSNAMPDGLHKAFLEGAKWWEFDQTGATMWQSDQSRAVRVAVKKYGPINSPESQATGEP